MSHGDLIRSPVGTTDCRMPTKVKLQQRVRARKDISDEEALSGTEERSTASGTDGVPEGDPAEEDFVGPEGRSSHREVTLLLCFATSLLIIVVVPRIHYFFLPGTR